MLFGLKNTGATYEHLMDKVFKDLIGQITEVYMDDMVVKSSLVEDHVSHLEKVFETVRAYDMRFDPQKCFFRVIGGKFLGFMITHRGI